MTDRRGAGHPFLDTSPTPTIVAQPPPVEAPVTAAEVRDAHWLLGGQDIDSQGYQAEIDAYAPIINALTDHNDKDPKAQRDIFGNTVGYFGAYRSSHPFAYQRIWDDVNRIRKTEPGFLPDIPANNYQEFTDWVKKREQAKRIWGQDIVSRQRGASQAVIGFGTDMASGFRDPVNLSVMALTGGAAAPVDGAVTSIWTTMARSALREGVINSATSVAQLPELTASRARFGETMTAGDAAQDVATAFGTGGIFGTLHTGGGAALKGAARAVADSPLGRTASEMATPFAARFATPEPIAPADIVRQFTATVDPSVRTPEQNAALHVAQRQADVDVSNPYEPTPAGMDAHADALDRVMADIVAAGDPNGNGPKVTPRRTPEAIAMGRERAASITADPNAQATFMARVRGRESGGNDAARPIDPKTGRPLSSAVGRYQFVEDTWLHYYKQRYGDQGMSRAQILAKRTDGAIQDTLMQDMTADNARHLHRIGVPETAGNLYVEHFLGQGGAEKLFRADPDTPIESLLSRKAIEANKFLRGKTAREVIEWAHARMGDTTHGDRPILRPETFGDDAEALVESQRAIDAADAEAAARVRGELPADETINVGRDAESYRPTPAEVAADADFSRSPGGESRSSHRVWLSEAEKATLGPEPSDRSSRAWDVYATELGRAREQRVSEAMSDPKWAEEYQRLIAERRTTGREDAGRLMAEADADAPTQSVAGRSLRELESGSPGQRAFTTDAAQSNASSQGEYRAQPKRPLVIRAEANTDLRGLWAKEKVGALRDAQIGGSDAIILDNGTHQLVIPLSDAAVRPHAAEAEGHASVAAESAAKLFDKPDSPEAERQAMSLEHDARLILEADPNAAFRLGDDEAPRTLADILKEQDEDAAAIEAARKCL